MIKDFCFNEKNLLEAKRILSKYPDNQKRSAVLPLLDLAQRQNDGWISKSVIKYIADYLSQPYMRILEVVTFYSMYNTKPIGKYHIQVCSTTPCWLRGAKEIMDACEEHANTKCGTASKDNIFTISEVECLGACVNAPIVQINDDYHEDLDQGKIVKILTKLKN